MNNWTSYNTKKFYSQVSDQLDVGFEMSFPAAQGDVTRDIWVSHWARAWVPSGGLWQRTIQFTPEDRQLIEQWVANPEWGFPRDFPGGISEFDKVSNDLDSLTVDYDAGELSWLWRPETLAEGWVDVMNAYAFRFPFKQRVLEPGWLGCLHVKDSEYALYNWEIEAHRNPTTIEKIGEDCWVSSLFADIPLTNGSVLARGRVYKLDSEGIELTESPSINRVLRIWK